MQYEALQHYLARRTTSSHGVWEPITKTRLSLTSTFVGRHHTTHKWGRSLLLRSSYLGYSNIDNNIIWSSTYPSCSDINIFTGFWIRVLCFPLPPLLNYKCLSNHRPDDQLSSLETFSKFSSHPFSRFVPRWKLPSPFCLPRSWHRPCANPQHQPEHPARSPLHQLETVFTQKLEVADWYVCSMLTLPLWLKREIRCCGSCWRAGGLPPRSWSVCFKMRSQKFHLVLLKVLPGWTILNSLPLN